jgi:hypothetical protein
MTNIALNPTAPSTEAMMMVTQTTPCPYSVDSLAMTLAHQPDDGPEWGGEHLANSVTFCT